MNPLEKNVRGDAPEQREYHSSSSGIFFEINRVLFKGESDYQRIEVIENSYFGNILLLDGLVQTTEKDEYFYHEMMVHPALVAHPAPKSVVIIGGGDGGVLRESLKYPLERAFLVEIDAQVIKVCRKYFPWLSPALQDKRSSLIVADGKEFIQQTGESFDAVVVDSSDPVGPSTLLESADFFQAVKSKLNPGGVVSLQMGSPFYHRVSIEKKWAYLRTIFKKSYLYVGPVPTYPGGTWCYGFFSDETDPLAVKRKAPRGLRYYNLDIHAPVFVLPNYLREFVRESPAKD